MSTHGATGGFVVTSGSFSNAANAFAEGRSLNLIDGDRLRQITQPVQSARSAKCGTPRQPVAAATPPVATAKKAPPMPAFATAVAAATHPCAVCAKRRCDEMPNGAAMRDRRFGVSGFPEMPGDEAGELDSPQ